MAFKENLHSIIVRSDIAAVRSEILWWGEAIWWPKNSMMRFVRMTQRPVQKGTRYRQEVLIPFAPTWEVEIEEVTDTSVTRRFLNGMFKGSETVSLVPQRGAVEIRYSMHYDVQGVLNSVLWGLIFQRLHDNNIEMILAGLKKFLEAGNKAGRE